MMSAFMVAGFFIAAGFALLALAIWNWHPRPPAKVSKPVYSPTVCLVLDMLSDGRDWVVDAHRARHPTGASIWIANSPEAAGLSLVGDAWPHNSDRARNVATTSAERKALFAAVKALGEKRQAEMFAETTADWAARVKQYADNVVNIRGAA